STSAVTSIPDWLSGAVRRRRPRVEISSQRGFPAFVLSSLWNRATWHSSLNVFTVLSSCRAVSGLVGQEVLVDIHLGRALLLDGLRQLRVPGDSARLEHHRLGLIGLRGVLGQSTAVVSDVGGALGLRHSLLAGVHLLEGPGPLNEQGLVDAGEAVGIHGGSHGFSLCCVLVLCTTILAHKGVYVQRKPLPPGMMDLT